MKYLNIPFSKELLHPEVGQHAVIQMYQGAESKRTTQLAPEQFKSTYQTHRKVHIPVPHMHFHKHKEIAPPEPRVDIFETDVPQFRRVHINNNHQNDMLGLPHVPLSRFTRINHNYYQFGLKGKNAKSIAEDKLQEEAGVPNHMAEVVANDKEGVPLDDKATMSDVHKHENFYEYYSHNKSKDERMNRVIAMKGDPDIIEERLMELQSQKIKPRNKKGRIVVSGIVDDVLKASKEHREAERKATAPVSLPMDGAVEIENLLIKRGRKSKSAAPPLPPAPATKEGLVKEFEAMADSLADTDAEAESRERKERGRRGRGRGRGRGGRGGREGHGGREGRGSEPEESLGEGKEQGDEGYVADRSNAINMEHIILVMETVKGRNKHVAGLQGDDKEKIDKLIRESGLKADDIPPKTTVNKLEQLLIKKINDDLEQRILTPKK